MRICALLMALGAVCLTWFIYEKIKKYSVKAAVIKSIVSVLFIAVALCGWYQGEGAGEIFGLLFVLGLLFGLLGDIWLDFKYVFPQEDTIFTYAGFCVFGVGHILFISAMLSKYAQPGKELYVIIPIALAVVLSVGNAFMEKPMKLCFGRYKAIVIAYGVLLFSTMFISGGLSLLYGWQEITLTLIFAGSILFTLSDLVLSGTFFGEGKDRPIDIILNYVFYYAAQFLIALSLLFLK